jgi:hypothetical protein
MVARSKTRNRKFTNNLKKINWVINGEGEKICIERDRDKYIMATLQSQYERFLKENADSNFTFEEWKTCLGNKIANVIINPEEGQKICHNCKHLLSMISLGQGLRCGHPNKTPKNYMIPSRWSTCEMFVKKLKKDA